MPEIEIRLAREDEFEKVNALYNSVYGNTRPFSYFKWEFIDGPAGKTIYTIAIDKTTGEIIATQCAIPLYMSAPDGRKILTAKSEDTYVNPAYRGLKIFDRLYELLFESCKAAGIKAIWGFTYALKPFKKVGFDTPFSHLQGVYVIDIVASYRYLSSLNSSNKAKQKLMIAGLCVLSKISSMIKSPSVGQYNAEEKMIKNKVTAFPKDKWHNGYCEIWQDNDYTRWRLLNNPYNNKYIELTVSNPQGEVIASVLLNMNSNSIGTIEQVIAKDDATPKDIAVAIQTGLRRLKKEGATLIRFWGFDHNPIMVRELQSFKSCGFVFAKRGAGFVWYDYNKGESGQIVASQVLLSRIYTQGNG